MPKSNVETTLSPRARFPWWQCYVLAGVAYVVLVYPIPGLTVPGLVPKQIAGATRAAGLPITIALLAAGPVLFVMQRRRRQQSDKPTGLGSILALSDRHIFGPRTLAHLAEGLAVLERRLDDADRPLFDALVLPATPSPISTAPTNG